MSDDTKAELCVYGFVIGVIALVISIALALEGRPLSLGVYIVAYASSWIIHDLIKKVKNENAIEGSEK